MSWTDVFPVLTNEQVASYEANVTAKEAELLEEWCGVAQIFNPQPGKHLVAATLFWKNCANEQGELPKISRELMKHAASVNLVSRYAPWDHYVQPLLDGATLMKSLSVCVSNNFRERILAKRVT